MAARGGVASSVRRSALISWCETEPRAKETSSEPSDQTSGSGLTPPSLSDPSSWSSNETRSCPAHLSTPPVSDTENQNQNRNLEASPGPEAPAVKLLLPRSSPVMSRRHRPISWHGGGANTSGPPGREQGLAQEQRGRSPGSVTPADPKARRSRVYPESSAGFLERSCRLDSLEKENSHLVVVDLVLEVLEGVKWTLSLEQSTGDQHVHTPRRARERPHTRTAAPPQKDAAVVLQTTPRSLRSAEVLAQQLVSEFRRRWLPSHEPRRGRLSLRSSLQELPGTGSVSVASGGGGGGGGSLTDEIRLRTRMRGTLKWTPPRFQILMNVQPSLRRSDVIVLQDFLCAGCGTEVESRYMKRLKYCDYLGRYFCQCCHSGAESVIPARVLTNWDFNRYPVSDFSKQLLDSVWLHPLFELSCVVETLGSRGKELNRFRDLLDQLLKVLKLLRSCRFSERVILEVQQLPPHLLSDWPPLVSMDDLLRLRKGQLMARVRAALHAAGSHVENCKLCSTRGFT